MPRSKSADPEREARRLLELKSFERALHERGFLRVAGVDEAGMGPLAGPVVAAAVMLPADVGIDGIDDSKKLSPRRREELAHAIRARAVSCAVGIASAREIDRLNVRVAGLLAMRRALLALAPEPQYVLVDAREVPDLPWPQEQRVQADAHWHAVACASVVAKTHRDRLMRRLDRRYPAYGFRRHKGYGTPEHLAALHAHGACPAHRKSFQWDDPQYALFGSERSP